MSDKRHGERYREMAAVSAWVPDAPVTAECTVPGCGKVIAPRFHFGNTECMKHYLAAKRARSES